LKNRTSKKNQILKGLALLSLLLFTACGEPVVYVFNQKEKVIERNAPPRPGSISDAFNYKEARGDANILWVVDNSYNAQILFKREGISEKTVFQRGFEYVTAGLLRRELPDKTPAPFAHVTFREQVVLSPGNQIPSAFAFFTGVKIGYLELLNDLFAVPKFRDDKQGLLIDTDFNKASSIARLRDNNPPTPFVSALKGITDATFKNRADAQVYVIFAIANVSAVGLKEKPNEYAFKFLPSRPISTVEVFNLTPKSRCQGDAYSGTPTQFLADSEKIGWNIENKKGDLCSQSPEQWAEDILTWIHTAQNELKLSSVPDDPTQLSVIINDKATLAPHQFRYNAARNSITLIEKEISPALTKGAKINVIYWIKAPAPMGGK
jgi:hypothetical protein